MQLLGCMFNADLSSLGLFLPVTVAIIIGINLFFVISWINKNRKSKAALVRKDRNEPPKKH
ncbi:MAG: hypothetical protein S4CHLAM37_05360 [Chlamydiia bacterium]|nr:hypothetical protein [Chlamydiia bacterium]